MRIAIVGAGPTGFFLAKSILDKADSDWRIDMFEKTPFPYGLVRFGVAPDHPKIKSVTRGFDKTLEDPRLHFWGGITIKEEGELDNSSATVADLLEHYHRVVLTVGCQDDRKLGIDQEQAANSFPATRFVGWYNGHPLDCDLNPNLKVERAAVVGAGNVAIDLVRLLISPKGHLATTDISDQAMQAIDDSPIKELDVLIRRGPWDAAFTNPEVKELLEFEDVQYTFHPSLGEFSDTPAYADRRASANMETFRELEARKVANPRCFVNFRFLVSPRGLEVDDSGQVRAVVLGHNSIEVDEIRSWIKDSGKSTTVPTQLFLRSVGYQGRALAGVSYCSKRGLIPSDTKGRVVLDDKTPVSGLYVSGWMRRGPSGVIGTNKKDATEVAETMLADPAREGLSKDNKFRQWLSQLTGKQAVSKSDWLHLDAQEVANGKPEGRPRKKFCSWPAVEDELRKKPTAAT